MKKTIYHILGFITWVITSTKLFIFDFDIYLLENFAPELIWILNYKLVFLLLLAAVLWILLGSQSFIKLILFIAFYPLIVLFWSIPSTLLLKKRWLLIFTYISGLISSAINFKKNLIITALFGVSVFLILNSSNEYAHYSSMLLLGMISIYLLLRKAYYAFTPSSIFAVNTTTIVTFLEGRNLAKSLLDEEYYQEDEELSENNVVRVEDGEVKVPDKMPILLLVNRGLFFVAEKLKRFKESRVYVAFFIIGLLMTFLSGIILFSFINYSIHTIDPDAFSITGAKSFFTFLYYSFNGLIMSSTSTVQPQSVLAMLVNMIQIIYGIGLFIILIGIVISVNTPKYKEDIDQVIGAFDYQTKQLEQSMLEHFKISVQQAIHELEKAQHLLANLIIFIDPDS